MYCGSQLRDILRDSKVGVKTIRHFRHLGPFTHALSSSPQLTMIIQNITTRAKVPE